jgi:hypothetical protein
MENTPVSIVTVQLLQLHNNGLHNTVSNSNSIVVEACLPRRFIATAVILLFISRSLLDNGSIRHNNNNNNNNNNKAIINNRNNNSS